MTWITLLDGGMGQELIRRSPAEPTPLWSAQVMLDYPELVTEVHLENIRAGARVIIVNAYSVTRDRLDPAGLGDQFKTLQHRACELALRARDDSGEDVTIAGCLSPLHWSYRPDLVRPVADTEPVYAEMAAMQAPHVDLILCETMCAGEESLGAVRGAAFTGKPVWVAWTVDDSDGTRLRSGETLAEANAMLDGLPVAARLVNCSKPEAVDQAMPGLVAMGGPVGAYANAFVEIAAPFKPGTTVERLAARKDLGPEAYAGFAMGWVGQGATIIGGCCEVSPAHIAEIARRMRAAGHEITGGANV